VSAVYNIEHIHMTLDTSFILTFTVCQWSTFFPLTVSLLKPVAAPQSPLTSAE
jgi:hypothetical protein